VSPKRIDGWGAGETNPRFVAPLIPRPSWVFRQTHPSGTRPRSRLLAGLRSGGSASGGWSGTGTRILMTTSGAPTIRRVHRRLCRASNTPVEDQEISTHRDGRKESSYRKFRSSRIFRRFVRRKSITPIVQEVVVRNIRRWSARRRGPQLSTTSDVAESDPARESNTHKHTLTQHFVVSFCNDVSIVCP